MQPNFNNVHPHPEWRRLFQAVEPLVTSGKKDFSFEELSVLAGCNILSTSGRGQFQRFRKEALKVWQIWFESKRCIGYEIIPANQHGIASHRRGRQAARKLKLASKIADNFKESDVTPQQAALLKHQSHVYSAMANQVSMANRQVRKIADKIENPHKITEADLEKISSCVKRINAPITVHNAA